MKILKTVLCVVCAGVIVSGCKGGEKKVGHVEESALQGMPSIGSGEVVKVADIFAKKAELSGKIITVHGKVVKVNLGIMGANWLHVQDGSGEAGTNDITVTTRGEAKVDDKVIITGTLSTDKDFGSGYKYAVIIENAVVTAE